MVVECVDAAMGRRPFDILLKNGRIVNVFDDTVIEGSIGIIGDKIAFVGTAAPDCQANEVIDGRGRYVLPGFIDSHMHLESSFLSPPAFAEAALSCGTTTVAADPHEIANAAGFEGVRALAEASWGLPLRILLEAPSTVPSAPGFEGSGYEVGPEEMNRLLDLPGVCGLGEVMNFNGVADGDEKILSVIEAAERRGVILDGHASVLTGRRLQAFRAAG
ncbi:MAG TPA: amidohydrolase family protein, partial [Oscillospiraceae bacterium]|nr:amidohydrolase family protein [Oscillospiraceae bacterium]